MGFLTIKIDWFAFAYIFAANSRLAFQQLTEQLFYFEFKQPYGVYRYYNQPYIETKPVHFDGIWIGFQAKFYDASTTLSDRKGELKNSISGVHDKYPYINKIIFYINKEPGISTTKGNEKPAYITDIEAHGSTLGIQIEWRGLNQLETLLLKPELEFIRDYFFATNDGIRQFLDQVQLHTKTIFDSISSDIPCGGKSIKVYRQPIDVNGFLESKHDILLVHGESGSGKSALIKDQLSEDTCSPVWLFRATDFNMPSIPEFARKFGNFSWDDVLSAFDDASAKICVIDSAERVFTLEHQETFIAAVRLLLQHGWRLIITLRTSYKDTFLNNVLQLSEVSEHFASRLTVEDLAVVELNNDLTLPSDPKLRDFVCNLFYLKLYLSKSYIVISKNITEYLHNVWEQVICNTTQQKDFLHIRRGQMLCNLVHTITNKGTTYYVPPQEDDWLALTSLADDDIIKYDSTMGGYFVTHDVYEEIVLKHIISQEYLQRQSIDKFYTNIGDSLIMRKAFRLWLHDQFDCDDDGIHVFLITVLTDERSSSIWKDEILVSLMSEKNSEYLSCLDNILKENEFRLLVRALTLINTACKVVDDELWQLILTKGEAKSQNVYHFTKPSGLGWDYLIPYVYNNRKQILWSPIVIVLSVDVLYAWTMHSKHGNTTRYAGLLALYLYTLAKGSEYRYRLGDMKISQIVDVILNSAFEILPELTGIFETVVEKKTNGNSELYSDLCEQALSSIFNCGAMCVAAPDLVFKLAKHFWLNHEPKENYGFHTPNISADFDLNNHLDHEYYPESAFKTPTFTLLKTVPVKTIDFIIELFNTVSEAYENSSLNKNYSECFKIDVISPNGERIKQVASNRLWQIHRGTSVAPDLLKSILMALERWLYFWIPETTKEKACDVCIRLLSKSRSSAITAVVTSIVTAYPDKLFSIACILLHTRKIFLLDIDRLINESHSNFLKGGIPSNKLYDDERIESNARSFRKKRLEDISLRVVHYPTLSIRRG